MAAIPHIHLLCMEDRFITAINTAFTQHELTSSISFEIHNCALQFVPASTKFDLIVSPANSYGRLDGGFDDAISRAFSPRDDYLALTKVAQKKLYNEWRGFAPPGTCTLVDIPEEYANRSKNVWGGKYLALCPTMRVPQEVGWDREVVYECVWSLLCAVEKHNESVVEAGGDGAGDGGRIRSMLVPPLATGIGRVSQQRWANQFVLAMKHFLDAKENPEIWSALEPSQIVAYSNEVGETWSM